MRVVIEQDGKLYELKDAELMCDECAIRCSSINTARVKDWTNGSICKPLAVMAGNTKAYSWEEVS